MKTNKKTKIITMVALCAALLPVYKTKESHMSLYCVFPSQMSSSSAQKILRFGRIISQWQEDGEILIGSRE